MAFRSVMPLLVVASTVLCGGAAASTGWECLRTEYFTVFHRPECAAQAREALDALEHNRAYVEKITGNSVRDLPVVVEDAGQLVNGFADPLNVNLHLYLYPPGAGVLPMDSWWLGVTVHEYTHLLHLTRVGKGPAVLTFLFGNVLNPHLLEPGWNAEGFAVLAESSYSPFSGRLNDGFYDAYLGASVQDGRFPSLVRATFTPIEYPLDIQYLAGAEFYGHMADEYSAGEMGEFNGFYGSSLLSYFSLFLPAVGLDRAARHTFGRMSVRALWREWAEEEKAGRKDFAIEGEKLTTLGWNTGDLLFREGRLWYRREYLVKTSGFSGFVFHEIVSRDPATGRERVEVAATSPFAAPMRIVGGKLYYANEEIRRGYGNNTNLAYGVIMVLRERDLVTGRDRVLIRDRIRTFGVLAGGKVVISRDRLDGFGSDICLLGDAGSATIPVLTSDLLIDQIAAEGSRIVVTARRDREQYGLYSMDIERHTLEPLVNTPWIEYGAEFYGDHLLFTANYGKVYSAYAYDFQSSRVSRLTEKGYAASPALDTAGNVLYFAGLGSRGLDIYRTPAVFREFTLPADPSPARPPVAPASTGAAKGGYLANLGYMAPRVAHMPAFLEENYGGLLFFGGDPIMDFPEYAITAGYDFTKRRTAGSVSVSSLFFAPFQLATETGNIGDRFLLSRADYPLYRSVTPGLASVITGGAVRLDDDFTRRGVDPFLDIVFGWPGTETGIYLGMRIERVSWNSQVDRTGGYCRWALRQYLGYGETFIQALGIYDPDDPGGLFQPIRGYSSELVAERGGEGTMDITVPVVRIRRGLWNPAVYAEDITAGIFADGAIGELIGTRKWQYSGGAEVHFETRWTTMNVPVDLGVRVVVNREGETGVEAAMGAYYLWGGAARVLTTKERSARRSAVPKGLRPSSVGIISAGR